jgi:choline kinase
MPRSSTVSQTVILAAGSGSRLVEARGEVPKPLMTLAGLPLIAHALAHARNSGCRKAVVVIGYEGARVRSAVEAMAHGLEVCFVTNSDYTETNGVSLLAAAPVVDAAFYLQMVDHVFGEATLTRLTTHALAAHEAGRVLVDRRPGPDLDLDDATRVRLEDGRVTAIGKRIEPWDAVDAGCFVLTGAVFDALHRVPADEPLTVSAGMRQLVREGKLGAVDLDGTEWVDVDTPADREVAERLLAGRLCASDAP